MVRRDGAAVRKERIAEMGRRIKKLLDKNGELPLSKTVVLFMYDYGLTKEKVTEYFSILEGLGFFILDKQNDKIRKIHESEEN